MRSDVPQFREATIGDIAAVMSIEAAPAYADQVGSWPEERHRNEMERQSSRYFVVEHGGQVEGFAIVQGIGSANRKVHLKRIAVRETGCGTGSTLLRELLDWLFRETDTHRIDLDVFEHNERARRAYEKAGFKVEGLLRDYHRRDDGRFVSMWMMSVLRPEWRPRDRNPVPVDSADRTL